MLDTIFQHLTLFGLMQKEIPKDAKLKLLVYITKLRKMTKAETATHARQVAVQ